MVEAHSAMQFFSELFVTVGASLIYNLPSFSVKNMYIYSHVMSKIFHLGFLWNVCSIFVLKSLMSVGFLPVLLTAACVLFFCSPQ